MEYIIVIAIVIFLIYYGPRYIKQKNLRTRYNENEKAFKINADKFGFNTNNVIHRKIINDRYEELKIALRNGEQTNFSDIHELETSYNEVTRQSMLREKLMAEMTGSINNWDDFDRIHYNK